MNVFDEISDRLSLLPTYRKPGCTGNSYIAIDDLLEVLNQVEQEHNISHENSFDPSWFQTITTHCQNGEQFSVSGTKDFIEMVRGIACCYGYCVDDWGIEEHHARFYPPKNQKEENE